MRGSWAIFAAPLLLLVAACPMPKEDPDAGTPDSGAPESGTLDTGLPDTGHGPEVGAPDVTVGAPDVTVGPPVDELLGDPGFEEQSAPELANQWTGGAGDKKDGMVSGASIGASSARTGKNHGAILATNASTIDWGALNHTRFEGRPSARYLASAWIKTSSNYRGDGSIIVAVNGTIAGSIAFGQSDVYARHELRFTTPPADAGSNPEIFLYIGYHGFGEVSWVYVDDVSLVLDPDVADR